MTSRTGVPAQTRVPSAVAGVQPVTRVPTGSRTGLANPATQRTVPTVGTPPVARVPSGATGQPVTRQPSGMPAGLGTNQPGLASRTRAPTGNSVDVQSNASVAQTRVAQQSTVTPRGATGTVPQRQPSTYERTPPTAGPEGSITPRTAGGSVAASRAVQRARRVSKVIVEKEKKTDYWQEIIQEARAESPDLSQDDVNAMVARCLSLDLVSNWKAREEQGTAPKARELFQQLEVSMDRKLTELNGGVPLRVPGTGFQKIKALERQLQILETKADKAQDDEAEKVKAKITELSNTLATVQKKKEAEREQNRRTMTMEISNLREQMQKAAAEPAGGQDSAKLIEENKKMAQKMARLESALRQMNDERKKGVEDNDTAMLKKKLTLFESRMKQLEEEKKLKESEEHTDTMRDKLLLMEEKLAKMERRKSVSITMMMQQKMQQVEEELSRLKSGGGGGSQVADLEKKLVEMQNTKVNPSMINDPETRALRSHIKKMEDAMLAAEKKMENDRLRLEEEREQQVIKRQREEEAYRKKAQQREQLLLEKMAEMEKRIASASRGGGPPPPPGARGGGGMDQALQKKMEELEAKMSGGAFAEQMAAMEKRIKETEERLAKEKQTTNLLHGILNRDGSDDPNMKDAQIANLTAATQDLMAKLEAQAKAMDDRFNAVTTKIETMSFAGPATHVHKSGLSYADINAKLEEIQKKLFDPDIEERESEQLNIEYEKLISELEGTAEYKAEQEAAAKKWKEENTPLNNAALAKLKQEIASWTPMKKTAQFKRKPELKFLEFTPDQINKKHVNDFKGVTTQNLTLEEARALFACMPEFRKDQEAQLQFHEQLKNKIETEAKKPAVKAPPPIKATKAVVFKRPPPGGDGGSPDFLAELMRKRKQVG